jgi:hypothetical protein
MSPASVKEEKRTISLCCRSVSGTVLHHTLPSYSTDCHPSSFLTLKMSRSDQKRGARRLDAIIARSGLDLNDGGELKSEGKGWRV